MIEIAPSMLSADFGNLDRDVEMINRSEASWMHLDVMDGVFVPNISYGFPVIKAIGRNARKPLDAHLMIVNPQNYVSQVRDCGVELMTVHQEVCPHLHRVVQQIKDAGMKAGVALNPATPTTMLDDILPELDLVLVMSVNPGFGGQKFIELALPKVKRLRSLIDSMGLETKIEVDGGVNMHTGKLLADAGADILVAGSFVFGADDPEATIAALRQL